MSQNNKNTASAPAAITTRLVLQWGAVALMAGVDFYLLHATLTLLAAADSRAGSVEALMYLVAGAVSAGIVVLTHQSGRALRGYSEGSASRAQRNWAVAGLGLYFGIVALVTTIRIQAGMSSGSGSAVSGLRGVVTEAPVFDPISSESLLAYLLAVMLLVTGWASYSIGHSHSKLESEIVRARFELLAAHSAFDAAQAERVEATEVLSDKQQNLERLDRDHLRAARAAAAAWIAERKAEVAVAVAETEADPAATGDIVRRLVEHLRESELPTAVGAS